MKRLSLIRYGELTVTPDTRDALSSLVERAKEVGWRLGFEVPTFDEEGLFPRELSLIPAGREVWLRAEHDEFKDPTHRVAVMWSLAIPLGFTPYNRYAVPGPHSMVFHWLGPWKTLMDRVLSEGRGHLAWPSVCCAAQVDVGVWEGDREMERFIQAQLHRIGQNVGGIDGVVGPRTARAFETMGLTGLPLEAVAQNLAARDTRHRVKGESTKGHLVVSGRQTSVAAYGGVRATVTETGAALDIEGPGRLVVDVGDEL